MQGSQRPRVSSIPSYRSSAGEEAIELADRAGLILDPWQKFVLTHALGEASDGKWAAFEVGLVVGRQNGKGSVLEARELAGLFLFGEKLIIHSAHEFATSLEHFGRILELLEGCPDFDRRIRKVTRAHGSEGITLKSGQRIQFRTRTAGGGRGFSCDCLVLDEAMILPTKMHGALLPTLSARRDKTVSGPQVWYTGSAVDEDVHEHGMVLAKIRARGAAGDDPALAYFEWSVDPDEYDANPKQVAAAPESWAVANPGLGLRIDPDIVANEQRSFFARQFAVERLSRGYWPDVTEDKEGFIPKKAWDSCADATSVISGPVTYSIDVSPQRDWSTICAAGRRPDGAPHVEVVDRKRNTDWLVERCVALNAKHGGRFVIDPKGQAGQLVPDLEEEGLKVHKMETSEAVAACAEFFDAVLLAVHDDKAKRAQRLRYPDPQVELSSAVSAAATRTVGEAWAWSRRTAASDITALVAATNALWGAVHLQEQKGRMAASMADYLRRNGMADPKAREDRVKDLVAKRQARVDAILKKARGDE